MIINYLTLAVRLLIRNPFFTFINLICLSVGFAMFFMLWQHAQSELRSDQYHRDADRIVRVGVIWNWTDDGKNWDQARYAGTAARKTEELKNEFGDFDEALEVYNQGNFESPLFGHGNDLYITSIGDKGERRQFVETKIAYADSNLFHFFTIPLIHGDAKNALNGLRATVLSESVAKKYFGDINPVGKVVYLNDSLPLTISGVFKDLPGNTHLNFNVVISTLHMGLEKINTFQLTHGYFKLKPGVSISSLKSKLEVYTSKVFGEMIKARNGNLKVEMFLQPLSEISFDAITMDKFTAKSRHSLVIIGSLAFVILGMAWVNYINLARANNQQRLKELGARKAVGANTSDFIKQFLLESALINFIAFIAALTLIQLLRTPAETIFQFHIAKWSEISLSSWAIVGCALVSGVLITGLYPGWVTIKSTPTVLFGRSNKNSRSNNLSKVLTTLQYASAIVLIAWVMAINLQLDFIFKKDIGLNRENIVVVELPFKRDGHFNYSLNYFTKQLGLSPAISGLTTSCSVVGDVALQSFSLKQKKSATEFGVDSNGGVDENFISFYDIKLIAGRNFSADNPADRHAIIISKIAAQRLGFTNPEEALGLELEWPDARVIGIIEDYAVRPLLSEYSSAIHGVRGIALSYGDSFDNTMSKNRVAVKIKPFMMDEAMAILKKEFSEVFPSSPFQTYFLDEHINQYYTGEKIFLQQISLFTGIAILIACLGLLGMMRIKVMEFAKEMAIRKVMGARLDQLGRLLLTPAFRQVVIATVLGLPISYYLNMEYLQKFSERISLGWWHYLVPVAIFVVLLFGSIVSLIVDAARANPVEALHHE